VPAWLNVKENESPGPGLKMPESQSGDPVGKSQVFPHSVVVCETSGPTLVMSHPTVSPRLIWVAQTPPWNDELQNQKSPMWTVTVCAPPARK
jgi:hypothetical protein